MTALIFFVAILLLAFCVFALPQIAIFWAIVLAILPTFLLLFWKKPTLPSSQNVYSVVFALAFCSQLVFFASNLQSSNLLYSHLGFAFFAIYVGAFCLLTWAISALLTKLTNRHYRLFSVGVLFSVAYCCIPQTNVALCAVAFGLLTLSASFVLASAHLLRNRLKTAANVLEKKDVSASLLARNVGFGATAINLFFLFVVRFCSPNGLHAANVSANIVCAVLNCVLLFSYLRQPLEDVAEHRIALLQGNNADVDKLLLREKLQDSLCNQQIFPFAMMLKKVLNVFFRVKTVGLEKVTDTSAVFVANHYEIFGPFITALKFPLFFRPWTDSLMTNKQTLTRQLRSGVEVATRKWLIKPIRKKLPALIANTLWKTLQFARALPIYRNNPEKIAAMLNESVETLQLGDHILVFPEKPPVGEFYKDGEVDAFQTGFVEIADAYKKQTGKDLNFYPLFVDKKGKKMIVGEKVAFNCTAPLHEEKQRIANDLFEKMTEMSKECKKERKK